MLMQWSTINPINYNILFKAVIIIIKFIFLVFVEVQFVIGVAVFFPANSEIRESERGVGTGYGGEGGIDGCYRSLVGAHPALWT